MANASAEAPPVDYLEQVILRAKGGEVFTIDEGDKPVAIVLPARYLSALQENFNLWNDGRLVLPQDGHGWRRGWNFLKFAYQRLENPPPPDSPYEAEAL